MTHSYHQQPARQHHGDAIRRSVLPGGLRLVTEEVPGAASCTIGVFVGVGSRDEGPAEHGCSHFLEHLLFKGTPTRSAEQISAEVERRGGDLNAYTTREYTCFHARVLASEAPRATEVLVDMLCNSLLRARDVGAERAVILDEIAMHRDDPSEVAYEGAIAGLFAGSEVAPNVIGSSTSIRRLTTPTIMNFWRERYRAADMVAAAVGRVDHDGLATLLEPLDAMLRPEGRPPRSRPAATGLGSVTNHRTQTSQASVVLAWPGLSEGDADHAALAVLATALGGGMSSLLFQQVRERRGLAYSIDCSESAWADAGIFTIDWQSLPERTGTILEVVRECLSEFIGRGIGQQATDDAVAQLVGQYALHFENPAARMGFLGRQALLERPRELSEVTAAFEAVTPEQVDGLARRILTGPPLASVASPQPLGRGALRRWA